MLRAIRVSEKEAAQKRATANQTIAQYEKQQSALSSAQFEEYMPKRGAQKRVRRNKRHEEKENKRKTPIALRKKLKV
jgi:hypothetical protein